MSVREISTEVSVAVPRLLSFFLNMEGRPALVVGAGRLATEKIGELLEVGARVTVIAPLATADVRLWHDQGHVDWKQREFRDGDVLGYRIVVVATANGDVDRAVHRSASGWSIPVNVVDAPGLSDFHFGSVVRRGPVTVAISTSGASPALAQRLKSYVDRALPERLDLLSRLLARTGPRLRKAMPRYSDRTDSVGRLLDALPLETLDEGSGRDVAKRVADWIEGVERWVRPRSVRQVPSRRPRAD